MATMKTLNGYGFNATEFDGKTASDYLLKTDTAADSAKLGGKASEYYLSPRNLLDNSDFRNPVNQRGQTEYSNVSYTYAIDRWKTLDAGTVTVNDGYITTTNHLVQFMPKALNGVYTAAAKMLDGTILIASGSISGTGSIGDGETIQVGTESDTLSYFALRKTGSYIWAALYEGSYTADTLPPYVPKGYAAELAECRRYVKRITGVLAGIAHGYANGKAYATIFTSGPKMRISPSVDNYSKIAIINGEYYSDNFTSIIGIATISSREDSITFWIDSSEISAGKDYYISCEKGVLFSADI